MRSVGFVGAGLPRHDFAVYQASFARQRFLVLGRQSAARIGVVGMCHLCRVVQCVLPLGRGKDSVRVVAFGYQGAEFDAETLQFTSSCKLSDVKRWSFCTRRPVPSAGDLSAVLCVIV